MDGISIYPEVGSIVVGNYGQYLVKNHIADGGNGKLTLHKADYNKPCKMLA